MSKTHENRTNDETRRDRSCTSKRSYPTLDSVLWHLDYYSVLYGKPFGYYLCQGYCGEFHLFTLKMETQFD